ncbi:YoaK family protein [Massilia sp. METH4]|uniref:YoaK family protein n=1 Tax=Massilia sp. METH4 TaxID=3123041 RepID=UPI0030CCE1EC
MRVPPSDLFLGICLGALAGYVDTAGFVALYGLFTAHVTGNFVLIGATLTHPEHTTLLLKCLAFPAFGAGVVATRLLGNACERKGTVPIRPMLAMQLVLLAAFMATALAAVPITSPDAPLVLVTGMLGAAAMGVHNAAGKLQFSRIAPTTVMTGNVTELLIDMTDLATGHATPAAREKFVRFVWPVLAFAVGCILGGAGYVTLGFWCLLAPIAAVAFLLCVPWPVANPAHA